MRTEYTIKNFRAFDENGVTVKFSPITILTGTNSSGKSSIVKSMVLLDTYRNSLKKNYENNQLESTYTTLNFSESRLDFQTESTKSLGNFKQILHRGSTSDEIGYSYLVYSKLMGEYIRVSLTFDTEKTDSRNNGHIASISIHTKEGELIYSSNKEPVIKWNFNILYNNYLRFLFAKHFLDYEYDKLHENKTVIEYNLIKYGKDEDYRNKHLLHLHFTDKEKEIVKEKITFYKNNYEMDYLVHLRSWRFPWKKMRHTDSLIKGDDSDLFFRTLKKYSVVCYCSLLREIGTLDRDKFNDAIGKRLKDKLLDKDLQSALNQMINDFQNSQYETFWEYYKAKEELYFQTREFEDDFKSLGRHRIRLTTQLPVNFPYLDWTKQSHYGDESADILTYRKRISDNVSFELVFDVIINLNDIIYEGKKRCYTVTDNCSDGIISGMDCHWVFNSFCEYITEFMEEAFLAELPEPISYLESSIVNVKRIYPLEAKDDFTSLLNQYLTAHSNCKIDEIKFESFVDKWVRKFKIGMGVKVGVDNEGLGACIRLIKEGDDEKGRILADEGYGITQLICMLLRIETAILKKHYYPIWLRNSDKETIAIEEPEVHLHPRFQSMLAEMFVDAYKNYGVHFIIETHSEYIIRKLQLMVANGEVDNNDISIQYVFDNAEKPDYEPLIKTIKIRKDGMLDGTFGSGFFDEADMLSMYLLTTGGGKQDE